MYPSQTWAKIGICAVTGAICFPIFKEAYMPFPGRHLDATNRTAIVTGASGNLGQAATYHLAKRHGRVIMACKDMEKCKLKRRELVVLTKSKNIVCRHLDLEDIDSINKFADDMIQNEPHIDLLIHNAAIKELPKKELTKYGVERMYFANFIGPFLLTMRLLDKLEQSSNLTKDSRVINVIGIPKKNWKVDLRDLNFDNRHYDSEQAYIQSKTALAFFTILLEEYNKKRKNNVYVFGASPSWKYITQTNEIIYGFTFSGPKKVWEGYYSASPQQAVGPIILTSLATVFADRDYSGWNYARFLKTVSWKGLDKQEIEAKLVWNNAVETLINIRDPHEGKEAKPKPLNKEMDSKQLNPKS